MSTVELTVNGRQVSSEVEPRTHLADFLREQLNLTGTHLRCEQGACGACTLLVDGQPARSCITYAVMCDGAAITTIEGLQDDPVMDALRRAFSEEHGLQCGYCTPGMLVTARDIVMRLPDADPARIRIELSGNLCRCTGYVGIVHAISRVLAERRRGEFANPLIEPAPIGPVGSHPVQTRTGAAPASTRATPAAPAPATSSEATTVGLAGRQPNVELRQSFVVSRPVDEVWQFFGDIGRVVPCLPGASLTRPPNGDRIEGTFAAKLGPITARFTGHARIVRDDEKRRGLIMGDGTDQFGGSRAAGEAEYVLEPTEVGGTRADLTIRALLLGPLAQFSRGAIVEDLVGRITQMFARNLESRLAGHDLNSQEQAPLQGGSLLWQVVSARFKAAFARIFRRAQG